MSQFSEIITRVFVIISYVWMVFSIIVFISDRWKAVTDLFKRWFNKPVDLSFQNDLFAEDTIKYRFRNILYDLNDKYEDAVVKLKVDDDLDRPFDFDEFYSGKLFVPQCSKFVSDDSDRKLMKEFYEPYRKKYVQNSAFLEKAPFIDVEHSFYYYILDKLSDQPQEIKNYMCDNTPGVFDPYKLNKKESIRKDIKHKKTSRILLGLDEVLALQSDSQQDKTKSELVEEIIVQALNTNSYDLSQLKGMGWHEASVEESGARALLDFLLGPSQVTSRTVNYMVDNAGVEFFSDLVLGYALVNHKELRIRSLVYHVNILPIYVSDVIESDLDYMFAVIEQCIQDHTSLGDKKGKYLKALSSLRDMFDGDCPVAQIKPDFIWNMPTPFEDIQRGKEVYENSGNLFIVKGDLNYRRLCKDKTWHYTKKLDKLTRYITSPTLVIRSFKSNVILDYSKKRVRQNDALDRDWRTDGKLGVIAFMRKKG